LEQTQRNRRVIEPAFTSVRYDCVEIFENVLVRRPRLLLKLFPSLASLQDALQAGNSCRAF
jgi:hypothetical protein